MTFKNLLIILLVTAVFGLGYWVGQRKTISIEQAAEAAMAKRVYEMRTYTANEGKLEALQARFRNHTTKLFQKHGMKNVGYWVPQDSPLSQNTLVYIISHESREQAKKNWDAFRNDPEWQKAAKASEVNGKLVSKVESVFMDATDYSPIK
ncbi:MAG TPA: NIPSNAP family protein [Blastocatellia bacterium]|nr:NIPSNAP family protein [Blastocatellia bacterium]